MESWCLCFCAYMASFAQYNVLRFIQFTDFTSSFLSMAWLRTMGPVDGLGGR